MKKAIFTSTFISLAFIGSGLGNHADAAWSTSWQFVSDYTFNGVSQTQNDPALQASIDYSDDAGWYAGTWASNVDFGASDDTDIEWDGYAGYYTQLTDDIGLDAGIAYYSYHGAGYSSDYNYPEIYAKFNYANALGTSEVNFWYSWDYFGLDVGHAIVMLAHSVEVAPGHTIRVSIDRSHSMNTARWSWDSEASYYHWRVAYQTSYKQVNFTLAAEDTNMDMNTADARVVAQIGTTFSF